MTSNSQLFFLLFIVVYHHVVAHLGWLPISSSIRVFASASHSCFACLRASFSAFSQISRWQLLSLSQLLLSSLASPLPATIISCGGLLRYQVGHPGPVESYSAQDLDRWETSSHTGPLPISFGLAGLSYEYRYQ